MLRIDAMEYVGPEDWPDVLARLRATVSGALIHLTVEQVAEAVIEAGYAEAIRAGWPAVRGETTRGSGHHHSPTEARVREWIAGASLRLLDEGHSAGEGYAHWHLLMTESSILLARRVRHGPPDECDRLDSRVVSVPDGVRMPSMASSSAETDSTPRAQGRGATPVSLSGPVALGRRP